MKSTEIALPEIGAIAATRGMLGAGIGLLLSDRMPAERRKTVGMALVAIGALSTIPLLMQVIKGMRAQPQPGTRADFYRAPMVKRAAVGM